MSPSPPAPRSSLINRDAELAFAREALTKSGVRLLTLTGPGGIGKTRLAVALATELASEFADGADFIPLAELRDPDLVLVAIARALGMSASESTSLFERLRARLASADLLLVLDNLEHVIAVAPELERLLEACPGVAILATSRTPLRLAAELPLPLRPLQVPGVDPLPSLDELRANEAVALLVERAQAVDPAFALTEANAAAIAEICARLEGLPLALELAATRLQLLSPAALLERLSAPLAVLTRGDPHLPERQQGLRNVIAWSDELLSSGSRSLFYCLAVFAGSCDAAAVEAVCGDPLDDRSSPGSVLDALAELLDHGLLQREVVAGEPRFTMSETICEYALERLEAIGASDAAHRRHAGYFLTLAGVLTDGLLGAEQESCLARLERERANFAAALRWSLAHAPETALRLAAALWRFWYARGHLIEGQRWLEQALAATVEEQSVARVRALNGLGVLVWATGDLDRALDFQDQSLALAREIDDAWGIAAAEGDRAILEFMKGGDPARAREVTEEVLNQFRALGDSYSEGLALAALGSIAQSQGDLAEAITWFREALAVTKQTGDLRSQSLCLFNLGQIARLQDDLDQAVVHHHEALALAHRLGVQEDLLYSLQGIAGIAVARRQFAQAARLLGAVAAIAEAIGMPLQPMEQAQFDLDVARASAALRDEEFARLWQTGRHLGLDDAVAEAFELTQPLLAGRNGHQLMVEPSYARPSPARDLSDAADRAASAHSLSQRELEVLRLLVAGHSDREIADKLFISNQTAMTHVKHIRTKLGVHSRAAAAAYAIRHGLV